jgi:eukaryotic-like serine/threonine-protein kinase
MADREQLIDELFAQAVELTPAEREKFLAERVSEDNGVSRPAIDEVRLLLTNFRQAESKEFLRRPLVSSNSKADRSQTLNDGQEFEGYRIIQLLGEGGMGEVYLAEDETLKRRVAIKLIKGHATRDILRRFQNERQILANLQHPNIAQLYEAGATADGLPFFVMEYVEGQSIDKFTAEKQLSLDDRLKLFRSVCAAVSYAHQNLVIHRDLKPGNVFVNREGEAKLLDFGIAKLLHEGDAENVEVTATLFRAMTPQYASPEQVKGEPITTATDVYSLGVLLYELLTGQRPYQLKRKTAEEITRAICEQEPIKPSSAVSQSSSDAALPPDVPKGSAFPVKSLSLLRRDSASKQVEAQPLPTIEVEPFRKGKAFPHIGAAEPKSIGQSIPKPAILNPKSLRGDLDNIILKALRKEPKRRYASVEQFSEDIRRYLQGLPVTARKDTVGYRTSKFIQRNKAASAAATLVFLTLIGGIIATAWQAHTARVQSARAEQRFNQVRALAHSVLFDYHDAIASLPGSTAVREKLVKDALKYLDELSADEGNGPELQRELAVAYLKVGDVQGRPYASNLGQTEGALASYKKALTILQALSAGAGANNELKSELATAYERIGNIQLRKADFNAALTENQKALDIRQTLVASDPSNRAYRALLADSYLYVGDALQATCAGDLQKLLRCQREALEDQQRALSVRQELAKDEPANPEIKRAIEKAESRIGFRFSTLFQLTKDKQYAILWLESAQAALRIAKELAAADSRNAIDQRLLADLLMATANAQLENGDFTGAMKGYSESLERFRALALADPTNSEALRDLTFVWLRLAGAHVKAGDERKAREEYAQVLEIDRRLLAADPANQDDLGMVALIHLQLSQLSEKAGNLAAAIEDYREAVDAFERLVAIAPGNVSHLTNVASGYAALARLYARHAGAHFIQNNLDPNPPARVTEAQARQWRLARDAYQKSLEAFQKMKSMQAPVSSIDDWMAALPLDIARCDAALRRVQKKV